MLLVLLYDTLEEYGMGHIQEERGGGRPRGLCIVLQMCVWLFGMPGIRLSGTESPSLR